MSHPLRLYGERLLAAEQAPAALRLHDGTVLAVPLERYLGPPDPIDRAVVARARGPVLDVGCGPGRHLHALAQRGAFALGVDLSPVAVQLATGRGAKAIVASIFDELPGGGSWRSALLLDGNIGIGGAPGRLLARIGTLLAPEGAVLVELEPPQAPSGKTLARLEAAGVHSTWFPWARVSIAALEPLAAASEFQVADRWSAGGRWFARLLRAPAGTA